MPYRDRETARARDRERHRRLAAERIAQGTCPRCGIRRPVPERSMCEECLERKRVAGRARYAEARAAGLPYGGRRVETRRLDSRMRGRRRHRARLDARVCTMCGREPRGEGGTTCEPCRDKRRAQDRERYAARRAAGCCGRCGDPAPARASRCRRCSAQEAARTPRERKNAVDRKRYARRRARRICTKCTRPSQGAFLCSDCARRASLRSADPRGLPPWTARFSVISVATGIEHASFETEAEALAAIAFERLSPGEVDIVVDAPAIAAAW